METNLKKILEVYVYNKEKGEMTIEKLVSEKNLTFKQATEELELSENERVIDIKKEIKTIDILNKTKE